MYVYINTYKAAISSLELHGNTMETNNFIEIHFRFLFIMSLSSRVIESTRKRVPPTVYTPTQSASMRCAYYLLFFNETESYQIVARSSIKKLIIKVQQQSIFVTNY